MNHRIIIEFEYNGKPTKEEMETIAVHISGALTSALTAIALERSSEGTPIKFTVVKDDDHDPDKAS